VSYAVFLGQQHIGTLAPDRTRLSFTYRPAIVTAAGPALSVRLPVRTPAFTHEEAQPFFANLLPEDEYRRMLARTLGLSDRNVAGLLGAIGGECAGAVSIWPDGQQPPSPPEYIALADDAVQHLFAARDHAARMQVVREGRLSLAGGMEKLSLRRLDDGWYRGRSGAPTTHILKWAPASLPDLNYNELFCEEVLREAGLPVVEATIEGTTTPVLVIPRFDRIVQPDATVLPRHQEDFCQLTGTEPAQKYEAEGGPGFAACADHIRTYASVPARDLALLVRWAVANYLIGNCDAHAKNLAMLYTPEGLRLAPFYDLASTAAYPGLSRKLAMSIGGEYRVAHVKARHWERFAERIALPFRVVRSEALALATAVTEALPATTARLTDRYAPQPIFTTIRGVIATQTHRLRAQLAQ
jgi:serine/threonine-protein kinase HipA